MFFNALFKTSGPQAEAIKILNAADYRSAITSEKVQLVDVRTPSEFRSGRIANAINIDFFQTSTFTEKFSKLNKDEPVFVYCRTGARSQKAARKLVDLGFTEIIDLRGGILQWR